MELLHGILISEALLKIPNLICNQQERKNRVMEYLAFDFGDGTTCAAHYNDSFLKNGMEPEKLNILRGHDEIWSIIGYDRNGENPLIGEFANQPGYKIRSNWKGKPTEYMSSGPDAWKRKAAVDFMHIVFKHFRENNQDYSAQGIYKGSPYTIVIGVPCDWKSADIEEYKKMADEAGLPNVQVVKESQAAMFYARRFMSGGIPDEDIRKGALLIDVGSSTTDFTYMRGADMVKHCGLALGAQAVERSFICEAMKREGDRYYATNQEPNLRVLAVTPEDAEQMMVSDAMDARGFKEAYFTGVDGRAGFQQITHRLTMSGISIGAISNGRGYITEEYIDDCLNDEGSPCKFSLTQLSEEWSETELNSKNPWREHFRAALSHVKKKWKLTPSTAIVVTGGATRMQFIEDDIVGVFDSKKNPYFGNDGTRSFSVVKGLAWCGFARDQIAKERKCVESKLSDEAFIESLDIDGFVGGLLVGPAEKIANRIRNTICDELDKHNECVNTCNNIGKRFSELMCLEWNALSGSLNNGIKISTVLKKADLENLTNSLYKLLGRPDIKVDKEVKAAFNYNMAECAMAFDPFENVFWSPDPDENFDTCLLDKWGPARDSCQENINVGLILGYFNSPNILVETGEEIPSFSQHLCMAIGRKIREFKLAEIDSLAGALEYGD